ncbi:hypothetical protein MTO96_022828 [Rhipicephalus appendiculatus]
MHAPRRGAIFREVSMLKRGILTLKASRFQWPSLPQLLERAAIASRRGGDDVDRHGTTTAAEPVGATRCLRSAQAPIDPSERPLLQREQPTVGERHGALPYATRFLPLSLKHIPRQMCSPSPRLTPFPAFPF